MAERSEAKSARRSIASKSLEFWFFTRSFAFQLLEIVGFVYHVFHFKATPHNLKSKLSLPTSAFSFLLSVDLAKSWLLPLAVQQERRPARQDLLPKQANITFPNSKAHFHCIVLVISEMISKRGIYIFFAKQTKAPSRVSTCDPGDFVKTKCNTRKRLFCWNMAT